MQGGDRQLEAAGQQQQRQDPATLPGTELGLGQRLVTEIDAVAVEPAQGQDSGQQAEPGDGAVEHESDGGPGPPPSAPNGHQQGRGNQHQLEGQHKQQGVAGQECPYHPQVGGQQQAEEQARAGLVDRGDENRQRGQQGRQQHQRQAQAIQAQIQSQPQFRQPGLVEVAGGIPPTEQPQQQLQ